MDENRVDTLEQEFLEGLDDDIRSGALKVVDDSETVYRLVANNFPISSGQVDWTNVPGSIEEDFSRLQLANDNDTLSQRTMRETLVFFARACDHNNLSGEMYFFNDGLDVVLSGTIPEMRKLLPKLYLENGHLYFVAKDGSWCMQKSLSRLIRFGFSPYSK